MQSIKNTTIGIMLLFLSYGVYQVIMKPMPARPGQAAEGINLLTISDPVEFTDHPSATANFEKPEGVNDLIPPKLLSLTPPELTPRVSNQATMDFASQKKSEPTMAEPSFSQPNSMSIGSDDSRDFAPKNQNQFQPPGPEEAARGGFSDAPGSINSKTTPLSGRQVNEQQINEQRIAVRGDGDFFVADQRQLDSDAEIMMTSGMTDVATPPATASEQTKIAPLDSEPQPTTETLAQTWPQINQLVEQGEFQPALLLLSSFYRAENLTPADREQMLDWLDALAAKVVYSAEHHLRSVPYIIQPGDTIASLAREWQVPAQLIYNVNVSKIPDPNNLVSGVEIKLIPGPFDAEIDSQTQTMTLFLDGMYAGRFDIRTTPAVATGEFSIVDKSASGQPERPWWISLNNGASMFAASGSMATGDAAIALEPRQAEEIFSILSATSTVRVLR